MAETEAVGEEGSWVVSSILGALEVGLVDHACEVYEESGAEAANEVLAAIKAGSKDVIGAGALMFVQARDFSRAARLYENLRQLDMAAIQYEAGGEPEYAGRCYERLGDFAHAASCYDAASNLDKATALYLKLGNKADAARCLLRGNRGLEAAKLYREIGNARGEMDALRNVRGDSPERAGAAKRLMEILVGRQRVEEACQIGADAIRESGACRRDHELMELLADLYEQQGLAEHSHRIRVRIAELGSAPAPAATPAAAARPAAAPPPRPVAVPAARPAAPVARPATPAARPAAVTDPHLATTVQTTTSAKDGGYHFLKAIPLFAKLTLEDMKDLYRLTTEVTFKPGETLIEQGSDGRGLFVVVRGKLDILLVHSEGTKKLNTLGPGAYVGEVSLLGKSKTSARVAAMDQVLALHIPPDQFEHFLAGRPQAALRVYRLFAENLAERVRALSNR